jgi:hypothetical protein
MTESVFEQMPKRGCVILDQPQPFRIFQRF